MLLFVLLCGICGDGTCDLHASALLELYHSQALHLSSLSCGCLQVSFCLGLYVNHFVTVQRFLHSRACECFRSLCGSACEPLERMQVCHADANDRAQTTSTNGNTRTHTNTDTACGYAEALHTYGRYYQRMLQRRPRKELFDVRLEHTGFVCMERTRKQAETD